MALHVMKMLLVGSAQRKAPLHPSDDENSAVAHSERTPSAAVLHVLMLKGKRVNNRTPVAAEGNLDSSDHESMDGSEIMTHLPPVPHCASRV